MPRPKKEFSVDDLRNSIVSLEGSREFSTQSQLFKALSCEDWAVAARVSEGTIYRRVRELGIELKTKPAPKGRPRSSAGLAFDVIVAHFQAAGITITDIGSILTSDMKSDAENEKIRSAW